jgi:hypothetical protein
MRSTVLHPGDRLLICSDGWGEALGESVPAVVEAALSRECAAQDLMNDLAFRLRRTLEQGSEEPVRADDDFPMPPEDCSVLVFDVAQNTLRLAK